MLFETDADEVEDFVNDGSNIPSTPVILKSDAVGNRKLSKAFSLDNAQPERVSLLRSTTIDGTTEKAKEQVNERQEKLEITFRTDFVISYDDRCLFYDGAISRFLEISLPNAPATDQSHLHD